MSRRAHKTPDPDRVLRAIHEIYGAGFLAGVLHIPGHEKLMPGSLGPEFQQGVRDGQALDVLWGEDGWRGDNA